MSKSDKTIIVGITIGLFIVGISFFNRKQVDISQDQTKIIDRPECVDGMCPPPGAKLVEKLADVPLALRQENYAPFGQGSCVWASTATHLRWTGRSDLAKWIVRNYHSGEYWWTTVAKLHSAGFRFVYTNTGDVGFLEWASRNRMCCGIFYFDAHAVNMADLNDEYAVLIDNNKSVVHTYRYVPRQEFLKNWRTKHGGFAWVILEGQPSPPWPIQE